MRMLVDIYHVTLYPISVQLDAHLILEYLLFTSPLRQILQHLSRPLKV